jgi:uncharacterized protein
MKRKLLGRLEHWKNQKDRKPLILKGARQVGKTYLLEQFGRQYFSRFHSLNFERDALLGRVFDRDLDPKRIIQELSFYLDRKIDLESDLLIFDEIQYCPRALTSLKYFCEELPQLALCSAGSLLGLQLGDASFPVGKVEFLSLFPMTFYEFLEGIGDAKSVQFLSSLRLGDRIPDVIHQHLWDQLKRYWVVGGLPEVVKTYREIQDDLFVATKRIRKKQEDLIITYQADMAKHAGKQNALHLERLWQNIPAQLAKEQNGSATRFRFKGIMPTVNRYSQLVGTIDWLKTAGLIFQVKIVNSGHLPLSAYTRENLFKLYLFDVGMLGALSQLSPKSLLDHDYGSYKGYFAENVAIQELIAADEQPVYAWRENTAEVEVLKEINGKLFPIEIKSGWVTQAKSLKVFADKYHPDYRTVFSAKNLHIDVEKKVHRYPLYLAARFPLD